MRGRSLMVLCAATAIVSASADAQARDGATRPRRASDEAQPTAFDRALLTETNLARTNPAAYAARLEEMLTCFEGNVLRCPGTEIGVRTQEGPAAVREAINFLRAQAPLPALEWSRGLWAAAFDHVREQGPTGQTGHNSPDGSSMSQRMDRYGEWQSTAAENISYGAADAVRVVINLIVDDGVPSRGHRTNIFANGLRVMGGACGPHRTYRVMCTIDYAGGFVDMPAAGPAKAPKRQ